MSLDTKDKVVAGHQFASAASAPSIEWGKDFFHRLDGNEAREWRSRHPQLPVVRALAWEALTGVLVAMLAWLITRRVDVAWSAAYGALAGVLPAVLAAWGSTRWARSGFPPGAALAGLLVWEVVKLVLTMGLLVAAPKFLGVPIWPALLVGLALTIKMYWVGLFWVGPGKYRTTRREHTDGC